jgi:pimeloyl-ACP methyl ester carboxylesterase
MSGVRHAGLKFLSLLILLGLVGCLPPPTSYIPAIISLTVPSAIPIGGTAFVSVTVNYTGGGLLTYSWDDGDCTGSFSPNDSWSASNSVYTAPTTTGTCTITIKVITRSGRYASASTVTAIVPLQATGMIGPEGGTLTLPNGISASIPSNFFTETTEVTLSANDSPLVPLLPNTHAITPSVLISFDTTHLGTPGPESNLLLITIPVSLVTGTPTGAGARVAALQAESGFQRIIRWVQKTADHATELIGQFFVEGDQILVRIPLELLKRTTGVGIILEVLGLDIGDCFGIELEQPKLFRLSGYTWEEVSTIETSKKPLLLIHGFQYLHELCIRKGDPLAQTTNDWKEFVEFFNDHPELQSQYEVFSYVYNTNHSMSRIVSQFKQKIGARNSLVILAHSMGGVVARSFMRDANGEAEAQVDKLITLGTPHHGTPFVNIFLISPGVLLVSPACFWIPGELFILSAAALSLRWDGLNGDTRFPSNKWLRSLNAPDTEHEKKIIAYGGQLSIERSGQSPIGRCLNALGYTINDTIVPIDSALYAHRPSRYVQRRAFPDYDHTEIRTGKGDNVLFLKICRDLGGCGFQPPPSTDPWPMFQHDAQRSGRSPYVGPQGPNVKWTFQDSSIPFWEPVVAADGTIYVGGGYTGDIGGFYAINPDGSLKWVNNSIRVFEGPVLGPEGQIYVIAYAYPDNHPFLLALNPDGTERWRYEWFSVDYYDAELVIDENGNIYHLTGCYSQSDQRVHPSLLAFNPQGSIIWLYDITNRQTYPNGVCTPAPGYIIGGSASSALDKEGNIYAVVSFPPELDGTILFALRPDGTEKWRRTFNEEGAAGISIDQDSTIYVSVVALGGYGEIHAIDPSSPNHDKWVVYVQGLESAVTIGTEDIYVTGGSAPDGTWRSYLYAFDKQGNAKWQKFIGYEATSVPILGGDGTIYIGARQWRVYAFRPDGSEKWSSSECAVFGDDAVSAGGSLAIAADGTLYTAGPQKLCAFGESATVR